MNLKRMGWDSSKFFIEDKSPESGLRLARVVSVNKGSFVIQSEEGRLNAKVSGKYEFLVHQNRDYPVVGDWVQMTYQDNDAYAIIHQTLPRRSCLNRISSGETHQEQAIAANIDIVFIVAGLDKDYSPRRIERYISLVWNSGAKPVLLLNKGDLLTEDRKQAIEVELQSILLGVDFHFISTLCCESMKKLDSYLIEGSTSALIGSSGVGKSSMINFLLNESVQAVRDNRQKDSKGVHTTTRRELFILATGATIIDTPGMRELQIAHDHNHSDLSFTDILEIEKQCKFNNCSHTVEKDCAVLRAVEDGDLPAKRLRNYHKLQKEQAYHNNNKQKKSWDSRLKDREHGKLRHRILHRNHVFD